MSLILILVGIIIGTLLGITITYYKYRNLFQNQKNLYNELQHNKIKFNEYQKELEQYFTQNIRLLNETAENYQQLYQNMTKTANFFLPNIHSQNNLHILNTTTTNVQNNQQKSMTEIPLDYSKDPENATKIHKN